MAYQNVFEGTLAAWIHFSHLTNCRSWRRPYAWCVLKHSPDFQKCHSSGDKFEKPELLRNENICNLEIMTDIFITFLYSSHLGANILIRPLNIPSFSTSHLSKLSCQALDQRLLPPNSTVHINEVWFCSEAPAASVLQRRSWIMKSFFLFWDLNSLKLPTVLWEPSGNRPSTQNGGRKPERNFLWRWDLPTGILWILWNEFNWKLAAGTTNIQLTEAVTWKDG